MNTILQMHQPAGYRLKLKGRIDIDWSDWLEEPAVWVDGGGAATATACITVVTGTVRDQAALFGLLSFVRDLGVPLISVELIQR